MKRFGFLGALLAPVAAVAGFDVAKAREADPHTTVRGVRASVKAFRNAKATAMGLESRNMRFQMGRWGRLCSRPS